MFKGTFIRRANTSLPTLQFKQKFKHSGGTLQKHCILTIFVLLDHLLAIGSDLLYHQIHKQLQLPQVGKSLTGILLKFLEAIGLGVPFG